jgi:hypothetical protein
MRIDCSPGVIYIIDHRPAGWIMNVLKAAVQMPIVSERQVARVGRKSGHPLFENRKMVGVPELL